MYVFSPRNRNKRIDHHIYNAPLDRTSPRKQGPQDGSVFIRQPGSRAVKIIDPKSGKERVTTGPETNNSEGNSQNSLGAASVQSQSGSNKASHTVTEDKQNIELQHAGTRSAYPPGDGELSRGFNVYAPPFVPEDLKRINKETPAVVYDTPPSSDIDFVAYASSELILGLLPRIPDPDHDRTAFLNSPVLTPDHYEHFFRFHLEHEWRYQQKENESYSLYGHEGIVRFPRLQFSDVNDGTTVTIAVPGLREDTPYIEQEDIVELRHLRSDAAGRLLRDQLPEGHSRHGYGPPSPWTSILYRARVSAMLRAQETLILHVSGLSVVNSEVMKHLQPYQPFPKEHRLRFNVRLPVPVHRNRNMEDVLPLIQASLRQASDVTSRAQNAMASFGSHDIKSACWTQSMLFPTEADCDVQANLQSGLSGLHFFDDRLNLEQRIAVQNVCRQNYGVLPYLISGPPGTGKTMTLIEIALQLINNVPNVSHILMCAPSEQAADTLAGRLRPSLSPQELFRLNRPSRSFAEVLEGLLPYCHIDGNVFGLPPLEQLMAYKIVVASCRDAAMLMFARVSNTDLYAVEHGLQKRLHPSMPAPSQARLHWNALLIDEAAQAIEPEVLAALWVVSPPPLLPNLVFTPMVVMAGDEHQLNPRTSCPVTIIQRSLFARLISRSVYANHPLARAFRAKVWENEHNPTAKNNNNNLLSATSIPPLAITESSPLPLPILRPAFTNLIRNYRSHPAILAVPSSLFYHDTLLACAPRAQVDKLAGWRGWRGGRRWPVLFHDNGSPDDLERDNGGWFNPGEAEVACGYAAALVASGLARQDEVCVMSPFRAQVRHVRALLRSGRFGALWGVNVGPTEAYQGLEHGVVILCTTRSRARFVERDRELGWGVIGMRNKMNVALTRAKFGLIIIGRRELLVAEDDAWKEVVAFCERNGLVADGTEGAPERKGGSGGEGQAVSTPVEGRVTRLETMLLQEEVASAR
ncbi:putative helicase MOV-10 [Madurella mycetomatis]|uniref:Helicase MOV-10 n=1 Tax=Madurella mycetomatis TaxID=100816 RepID=A0A175WH20_9PEZI|nr:putative helicase MOV-10 [Madurella mycetomatis]